MLTSRFCLWAAFTFVFLAPAASADSRGIQADKLKQLQSVGRNVVMQSVEKAGVQGEQRKLMLNHIARVRNYFSSSLMAEMHASKATNSPVAISGSEVAGGYPGRHLSWTQEAVSTAINILYDGEHAERYRNRRAVFRAIEDLETLSDELSGSEWWWEWGNNDADPLRASQSQALKAIVSELETELDFRQKISHDRSMEWIGRLTLMPGTMPKSAPSPMIRSTTLPDEYFAVGE